MPRLRTALLSGCLATACLAAGLHAQTLWVVDAKGRAGAQFSQLQPALDAASPGDVVIVRDGLYLGATVTKGVQIHARPGAMVGAAFVFGPVQPGLEVRDVPAGQHVVVQGLSLRAGLRPMELRIADCVGFVTVEDVVSDAPLGGTMAGPPGLVVRDCARVILTRCRVLGRPTEFARSSVSATDCTFAGNDEGPAGTSLLPAGHGLRIDGGDVDLARCRIASGRGAQLPEAPAMLLVGGTVTLGCGSSVTGEASALTGSAQSLVGTGTVIADPGVPISPTAANTAILRRPLPVLAMRAGVRGGTITGDLHGEPLQAFMVVFGLPAPRVRLPIGTAAIAPTAIGRGGAGLLDLTGQATWTPARRLPRRPRGAVVAWQAVVTTSQGFAITNVCDQVLR